LNGYEYLPIDNWINGEKMSDKNVDGIIYIKSAGKYYKLNYRGNLNGELFGANSQDLKDDTEAVQKGINFAIKTSQNIVFNSGTYIISKTIIIPQHFHYSMKPVLIDFSNATLKVNNQITLFQSDNWRSKIDGRMTNGIQIGNFEIDFVNKSNNNYALQIQDFHQGTKIFNVAANNVKNLIHSINSYYLELDNINSNYDGKDGVRFKFEGYHGLNKFSKLSAVNSKIGYLFTGGMISAVSMNHISVEGCDVGISFESEVYSFALRDSYLENFTTALKFNNYIHSAIIENNYVNFLNKKNIFLLDYKGLPANNIHFNSGNTYTGTDFSNLIKNKEDVYGNGVRFDLNNINNDQINKMKTRMGKNISVKPIQ